VAGKRNYQSEYANYQGKPDQIKKRAERNAARAEYVKSHGKSSVAGKDVDHKKPLVKGGSNASSNLRVASKHDNRSFKRTKSSGMK
jgi:5-methylcytosine-specific restriction endonuclease McrA